MEAARAAAIKGHEVDIYEAKDTVGGQFVSAAYPPYKGDYGDYTAWLYREIQKYPNIRLHLNTELTVEMIEAAEPDKVIIATGAKPFCPELPGIHGPNVVQAEDALLGKADVGMRVVVAGAGTVGVETAAYLAMQCKTKVTLLSKYDVIGKELDTGIRDDVKALHKRLFVDTIYGAKIAGATNEGALVEKDGQVTLLPCDTVVLAIPIKHVHPLGKCNRQMSAMLKKHRATTDGEDSELEDQLIEEMDSMEDSQPAQETTDPRWDALRKLGTSDNEE